MARKRKGPGRMIPREVRAADTSARLAREASMSQSDRDARTIAWHIGADAGLRIYADTWLGLAQDDDLTSDERELRNALAREISRQTGKEISEDLAYSIIDPEG